MKPRSLGTPNFFSRKAKKAFECCWFASGFRLFKLTCQKHSQSARLRTNEESSKRTILSWKAGSRVPEKVKGLLSSRWTETYCSGAPRVSAENWIDIVNIILRGVRANPHLREFANKPHFVRDVDIGPEVEDRHVRIRDGQFELKD